MRCHFFRNESIKLTSKVLFSFQCFLGLWSIYYGILEYKDCLLSFDHWVIKALHSIFQSLFSQYIWPYWVVFMYSLLLDGKRNNLLQAFLFKKKKNTYKSFFFSHISGGHERWGILLENEEGTEYLQQGVHAKENVQVTIRITCPFSAFDFPSLYFTYISTTAHTCTTARIL